MKTEKTLAFLAFICIIFICTAFCSCSDADIIVSYGENKNSESIAEGMLDGEVALLINISSGTFHLDEKCGYAANIKEENKKTLLYSDVRMAVEDGYTPCSACAGEYKN